MKPKRLLRSLRDTGRHKVHKRRHRLADSVPIVGVTVVSLILLVLLRGESLVSSSLFDPNEATLLAWGKEATRDLLPYKTYTATGVLYLWPLFLGILGELAVPLSLITAHILSGLAYTYLAVVGWHFFYRQHGWKWATAIIAPPTFLLFAASGYPDLLSLSPELLPIALLTTALLILFPTSRNVTSTDLAIVSTISGASIWADFQVIPLAIAFVVSGVIVRRLELRIQNDHLTDGRQRRSPLKHDALIAMLGFLLPTILSLIIIASTGGLRAFMNDSWPFLFGNVGGVASAGTSTFGSHAQSVGGLILSLPFAAMWALGGLLGWSWTRTSRHEERALLEVAAWVLPLASAVIASFAIGTLAWHDANILYVGAMISGVIGCRISRIPKATRHEAPRGAIVFRVLVALAAFLVLLDVSDTFWSNVVFLRSYVATIVTKGTIPPVNYYYFGPDTMSTLCPANSQVLVWGWAPELYIYYGWEPTSRYVTTDLQIYDYGYARYYRTTLLAELKAHPPMCIVEAVGARLDGGFPRSLTLASRVPKSRGFLRECYVERTAELGSVASGPEFFQPVTVYVRRNLCRTD